MRTAKAWVSALGMVITALSAAFADDVFNGSDVAAVISTVILAAGGVYAVYQVPNKKDTTTL